MDDSRVKPIIMTHTPQSPVDRTERTNTTTSATAERTTSVGWTDISDRRSPPTEAAVEEESVSAADSPLAGVTIPGELPDPEVTLFRDSTSVIRLLRKKRTETQFELRLYRADDQSVAHIVPASDSGSNPEKSRVAALPKTTRRRFEAAVTAVTEQFSLSVAHAGRGYGHCRHRRSNHGFCGVLEFGVTLQADEPSRSR